MRIKCNKGSDAYEVQQVWRGGLPPGSPLHDRPTINCQLYQKLYIFNGDKLIFTYQLDMVSLMSSMNYTGFSVVTVFSKSLSANFSHIEPCMQFSCTQMFAHLAVNAIQPFFIHLIFCAYFVMSNKHKEMILFS